MPILDITLVQAPGEPVPANLALRLADAAGDLLHAAPGTVWLTLHLLPATQYAENRVLPSACPHPAIVRVLMAASPDDAARATLAAALAQAMAPLLARPPAQVHVLFEPPAAGRMAFGGQLR